MKKLLTILSLTLCTHMISSAQTFYVEKTDGEYEYLVRWEGYSSKNDTWEPCINLIIIK